MTAGQFRACDVLLAGGKPEDAAAAVGVTVRTIERWQEKPEFQEWMREFARASFRESRSQLLAAQAEAVATLREALRAGSQSERIGAARALLAVGLKAADDDLTERLERLEGMWRGGTGPSESQHLRVVQPR